MTLSLDSHTPSQLKYIFFYIRNTVIQDYKIYIGGRVVFHGLKDQTEIKSELIS
jgi:hypothetical protein